MLTRGRQQQAGRLVCGGCVHRAQSDWTHVFPPFLPSTCITSFAVAACPRTHGRRTTQRHRLVKHVCSCLCRSSHGLCWSPHARHRCCRCLAYVAEPNLSNRVVLLFSIARLAVSHVLVSTDNFGTWRNITLFVAFPTCALVTYTSFLSAPHPHAPEFVPYQHLRIRRKVLHYSLCAVSAFSVLHVDCGLQCLMCAFYVNCVL